MSGIEIELADLVKAVHGTLRGGSFQGGRLEKFKSVTTDSRLANLENKIFIPLVGDQFDGHDYVVDALKKNVGCVLVHRWDAAWEDALSTVAFIEVKDTLKALQDLGAHWRQQLSGTVIGISGSNGKTSTKDFTAQILKNTGKTTASKGSFNNHWGVPLSLLEVHQSDKFAVMEMGMNHPGELTDLNAIAKPDVVCVTNVGKAHLGFFSSVDEIAKAKKELYDSAPAKALFVMNKDNPWTSQMASNFVGRMMVSFSLKDQNSDVFMEVVSRTQKGVRIRGQIASIAGEAEVSVWGAHNVENLAAASAIAMAAGAKPKNIWKALETCHLGWGRNQWLKLAGGGQVVFDGYNANPDSFRALFENLEPAIKGQRALGVFGEMLELGDKASEEHFQLGRQMASLPWEAAFFIGQSGADVLRGWQSVKSEENLTIADTYEHFLDFGFSNMLREDSLVIVKGSRGLRLERVVKSLRPLAFSKKPS